MNKINKAKAVLSLILGYVLCMLTIGLLLNSGLVSLAIKLLLFGVLYLIIKTKFGLAAGILGAGAGVYIIMFIIDQWLEITRALGAPVLIWGPLTAIYALIIYHIDTKKAGSSDTNDDM